MKSNIDINDIAIRTELLPGDIGYVTWMHGVIYGKEYDCGGKFEAYVAAGRTEFYKKYESGKEGVGVGGK